MVSDLTFTPNKHNSPRNVIQEMRKKFEEKNNHIKEI